MVNFSRIDFRPVSDIIMIKYKRRTAVMEENIMKKFICITLALALLALSGCDSGEAAQDGESSQSGEAPAENTTENNEAGDVTYVDSFGKNPPVETSEYPTTEPTQGMSQEEQRQLMIDNSLMSMGDTSRMVKVLQKAASGQEITIGCIGGSITEGLTAGAEKCWAKLTYDALCEMYPDTKINYVNAGLSGTPSVLGVVRAERDLYSEYTPDIVFVEFAVNDGGDQIYKDSYESLVRKLLEKENEPAVVLLFTVLKNEYSCQPWMTMVGEHYDLPMISVGNAINPMFHEGLMKWEDYSEDESHPNVWGHELLKDFNMNYFSKVKEIADQGTAPEIPALPEDTVYSDEYKGMKLLERDEMNAEAVGLREADSIVATFNNGWIIRKADSASVKFTAEFRTLFLVFNCNNSDNYGNADVYIDGVNVKSISSGRSGGWGNPEADIAWSGGKSESHEVEIKMEDGKYFGLLGVGVSD